MNKQFISFVRETFNNEGFIPLHTPIFFGNEKAYLNECIDSTFVSSVGKFVTKFENDVAKFTDSKYAIATVNGTAALHIALKISGVEENDEVISQALTFVATANAISYLNAHPLFIDVDRDTLGLSPSKLESFLKNKTYYKDGFTYNKSSHRRIKAIVPMHTFGFPARIDEIVEICKKHSIDVIEDAAESLGSYYKGRHTGTFGLLGTLSFNGNKTITTGGGGMILTSDDNLAKKLKHITTTAKVPHRWDFEHDMIGYNYRLPNINAALGCAQMENLPKILERKKWLSNEYQTFFKNQSVDYISEQKLADSNYWLNAVILKDKKERDKFLQDTNNSSIMTRPIWKLMSNLPMFKKAQSENLDNSIWLEERVVNIPSSVII